MMGKRKVSIFSVLVLIVGLSGLGVGMYNGGFTNHYSVHLQDVRNDLLSGVHTVTVVIIGTYSANYIWESSLIVQKVSNVE
ncbi:unnamed protein product [marine sediment metagenome]|uniref:Uncharacterized protein n=1 Tax=marine sediment metagenome TaxID=412755 RepID=X1GNS7_9ZZZZ